MLADLGRKIGLLFSAILIMALLGAGIGLAILLRLANLDMGAIVVPSIIIEIFTCIIAYQFASNFFPKEGGRDFTEGKKSSRGYKEVPAEEKEADSELPERTIKP